jgi:acylphosphatase
LERLEIRVRGRVQGVAFRWHARTVASGLGVTGWVRNEPDGSVRIVAEGEPDALEALAGWAERGPDHARVERRELLWGPASGGFAGFEIRT